MVEGSKKQKRNPSLRKTRKIRGHTDKGLQSIPELKRNFDRLNQEVSEILRSGEKGPARVKRFQQVWRKIFGRPVDKLAAEAYLEVKQRSRHRTAESRKQKGGMAPLSGAPLDYQTRPGIDGTHGSFLPYVGGKELGFYDTINQEGLAKGCGIEDSTPKVAASMGSNEVGMQGGGVAVFDDMKAYWQGRPALPSPAPSQRAFEYM